MARLNCLSVVLLVAGLLAPGLAHARAVPAQALAAKRLCAREAGLCRPPVDRRQLSKKKARPPLSADDKR